MTRVMNPESFKKPRRGVKRVFIHCTAAETRRIGDSLYRWCRRVHSSWSDVGYHFMIDIKGNLIRCRDIEAVPAAQVNRTQRTPRGLLKYGRGNPATIAICLDGNLDEDYYTKAQLRTLQHICQVIDRAYDGKVTFHGHKEIARKACPVIDYKRILKLDDTGRLGI